MNGDAGARCIKRLNGTSSQCLRGSRCGHWLRGNGSRHIAEKTRHARSARHNEVKSEHASEVNKVREGSCCRKGESGVRRVTFEDLIARLVVERAAHNLSIPKN